VGEEEAGDRGWLDVDQEGGGDEGPSEGKGLVLLNVSGNGRGKMTVDMDVEVIRPTSRAGRVNH
jgi:hypothetical protein